MTALVSVAFPCLPLIPGTGLDRKTARANSCADSNIQKPAFPFEINSAHAAEGQAWGRGRVCVADKIEDGTVGGEFR